MALLPLWVDKYSPQFFSDVIFSSWAEREQFNKMVELRSFQNLLLIGVQGTGKTTTSNVLIHEVGIDPIDVLRINCSDEKIDAIRDKVKVFAYSMAMGEFKVVQLEEMDFLSQEAQGLLRVLMEDVSEHCRFIATANYVQKILPAIRSRFQEIVFSIPDKDALLLRAAEILEKEQVLFDLETLETIIRSTYPDIRKTIQVLESCSSNGKLVLKTGNSSGDWKLQLLPLLKKKDFVSARKLVCATIVKEEITDVFTFLYFHSSSFGDLEEDAIIIINRYQVNAAIVADQELNLAALFIELGALYG